MLLYLLAGLVANNLMQGLLVHVLLDLLLLGVVVVLPCSLLKGLVAMLDLLAGLGGLCQVEQCIFQVIFPLYLEVNVLGYVVKEVKGFLLVFLVE